MQVKQINIKLISLAKLLRSLSDEDLEKVLINRAIIDRVILMKKNNATDIKLLEVLTFRNIVILESFNKDTLNLS